ncbi:site-specific integrase [Flavobacterium ginsenosidimutans]|uniref:Site-specific integrase n=1 Tax=Flavobacterium ginsenosidimutans TaxID=687844 RepID=A0ABZ2Q3U9_9FLAO|nr:site-specific integrase [Flavobacterium ginsenosidimutans]KAF2328033.1 site-specific integrase [Flavobacterium ginsenosidimutans]
MNKSIITLRKKAISGGRLSLYLDYYPPYWDSKTNSFSRREFLKLYLYQKPANQYEKAANAENLHTAELIRARKQNEINKSEIYSAFEKEQLAIQEVGRESFLEYYKKLGAKKVGNNLSIWTCAITHFEAFLKGKDLAFNEVTVSLIEDFRDYLLKAKSLRKNKKQLSRNTALSYYNKIKTTLKAAYREDKLKTDINAKIGSIKEMESQRNFMTLEETRTLFATPCPNLTVRKISMFSVLTGVRYSDIAKLTWSELHYIENDGHYIIFRQKKTEGAVSIPISDEAFELLGKRKGENEKVFKGLNKWDVDRALPVWVALSGISKHITFHCFRHTYATLQLTAGTDIFTISKMLGHKSVKTTQIYAKVIDQKKRDAANRISIQ